MAENDRSDPTGGGGRLEGEPEYGIAEGRPDEMFSSTRSLLPALAIAARWLILPSSARSLLWWVIVRRAKRRLAAPAKIWS